MNTLFVDTSDNRQIRIGLARDGKKFIKKQKVPERGGTAVVLPLIDSLLKEQRMKIEDLEAIVVNVEEGSFTGLRVGMAIANALSFALKIPVFKKEFKGAILKE